MPTCSTTDETLSPELTSLPSAEEMDIPTCSVASEEVPTIKPVETHTRGKEISQVEANTCLKLKVKNKGT